MHAYSFGFRSLQLSCAVIALLALAGVTRADETPLRTFPYDVNGDATSETVKVFAPMAPTTSTNGLVQVRVTKTDDLLLQLPPASGGGSPSGAFDRFGFAVQGITGLHGAGSRELVVTSPIRPGIASTDFLTPNGLGGVGFFNADSGAWRMTIAAPPGARLGLDIADIPDQDLDGSRDVLVAGAQVQVGGRWSPRTFVYSGFSGRLLTVRPESLGRLVAYANGEGILYLPGDLDGSGSIDTLDLTAMLMVMNSPATANPDADLDHNGVIDALDVQMQITGYLSGRRSIASATVPESSGNPWDQFITDWSALYTGQLTVTASTTPPPPNATGSGQNPTFPGFNVIPCSCTGSPGVTGGSSCPIGIANCPGVMQIGQSIDLESSGGGSCTWSVVGPPGVVTQTGNHIVATGNGFVAIHLECNNGTCCGCAECLIRVFEPPPECHPTIHLRCCAPSGDTNVSAGGQYRLFADVTPPGGHFTWTITPSHSDAIDVSRTRTGDWPNALIGFGSPPAGGGDWAANPRRVTVVVTYEVPGCPPAVAATCTYALQADSDHDGLLDSEEAALGTNPNLADSDGDGWPDGCEVKLGSNPNSAGSIPPQAFFDSDKDGLSDAEELCRWGTDPNRFDTDGDGVSDLAEVTLGLSTATPPTPLLARSQWLLNWGAITQCESLHPIFERQDPTPTPEGDLDSAVFKAADKDGDLLIDSFERQRGLDPLNPDTDGDGVPDGIELLAGRDPLVFDPTPIADTDGDGIADLVELYVFHTDPLNPDTDGDGLPDGWEVKYGLNPNAADSDGNGVPDGSEDMDGDGLSNLQEYQSALNPLNTDSDGDGTSDLQEILVGGDPANAADNGRPPHALGWYPVAVCASSRDIFYLSMPGRSHAVTAKINNTIASIRPSEGATFESTRATFPIGKWLPTEMRIQADYAVRPFDWFPCYPDPQHNPYPPGQPWWQYVAAVNEVSIGVTCGQYANPYFDLGSPFLGCGSNPEVPAGVFEVAAITRRRSNLIDGGWYCDNRRSSLSLLLGITYGARGPYWHELDVNESTDIDVTTGEFAIGFSRIETFSDSTSPSGMSARLKLFPESLQQENLHVVWVLHAPNQQNSQSFTTDNVVFPLPIGWQGLEVSADFWADGDRDGNFVTFRGRPGFVATNRSSYTTAQLFSGSTQLGNSAFRLMIDSTNTLGFGRSYGEGASVAQQAPGKLIFINDGDADGDGIPDWADGFKFTAADLGAAPATSPGAVDQIKHPGIQKMAPLVVRYNPAAGQNLSIRFSYTNQGAPANLGSDPSNVTMVLPSSGNAMPQVPLFYLPGDNPSEPLPSPHAAERYRLWSEVPDRVRDPRGVADGGHYVTPNVSIPVEQFDPTHVGEFVLFVEAVRPNLGNQQDAVVATILGTNESSNPSDTVAITALQTRMIEIQKDSTGAIHPVPVSGPRMSSLQPVVTFDSATPPALSNVQVNATTRKLYADLRLKGTVDDPLADLTPGSDGEITYLVLLVNGSAVCGIEGTPIDMGGPADITGSFPIQSSKQTTSDPLHPYDYTGTFDQLLNEVEVLPGQNHIQVLAFNRRGDPGRALFLADVNVQPPPDESYDIEINLGGQNPFNGIPNGTTAPGLFKLVHTEVGAGSPTTWNNVALTFSGNGVWAGQLSTGNQVRVEFPATAAAESFATAATITVPLVHLNNTTFDLERSAAGDPVWRSHRDIDEFDRTPYERCAIAPGSSQIVPSAPNDDFPFVYQYLGPSSLATTLDAVDLFHGTDPRSRGQYVLRQMTIGDGEPGWYFVRIAQQPGGTHENLAVFHVVPRSEPAPADGSPKPGHGLLEYHFHEGGYWPPRPFLFVQGHARGSFDSGWSMVEGTWDIIKFGATISWKTSQVRKVYRFVRDGGTLEPMQAEDNESIRPAVEFLEKLAKLVIRLHQDEATVLQAVATDDYSQIEEIRGRYGAIMIELLQLEWEIKANLGNVVLNFDEYDWGYLQGRIGGEVAIAVGSFVITIPEGGIGIIPKITSVINALKKIKGMGVVEKIEPLVAKLLAIITRLDAVAQAITKYKAEACAELWTVFERILGKNPNMATLEAIKKAIAEVEKTGASMTQAQRRDAAFALSRRLLDKGDGATGRKFLTYDEWLSLLGDEPNTLGRIRRGTRFDINHGSPREYIEKYIFPDRDSAWVDQNVPCHPLDIVRHRESRGHVQESFHDITDRLERQFRANNGPRNPTARETRQLIHDAYEEMHGRYSEIDNFDYSAFGRIVDDWLVSQGCP